MTQFVLDTFNTGVATGSNTVSTTITTQKYGDVIFVDVICNNTNSSYSSAALNVTASAPGQGTLTFTNIGATPIERMNAGSTNTNFGLMSKWWAYAPVPFNSLVVKATHANTALDTFTIAAAALSGLTNTSNPLDPFYQTEGFIFAFNNNTSAASTPTVNLNAAGLNTTTTVAPDLIWYSACNAVASQFNSNFTPTNYTFAGTSFSSAGALFANYAASFGTFNSAVSNTGVTIASNTTSFAWIASMLAFTIKGDPPAQNILEPVAGTGLFQITPAEWYFVPGTRRTIPASPNPPSAGGFPSPTAASPELNAVYQIWNIAPDPQPILPVKYIPVAPVVTAQVPYTSHQVEIVQSWTPPDQQIPYQTLQSYYGSSPQYVQLAPAWIPNPTANWMQQNVVVGVWNIPPDPMPILEKISWQVAPAWHPRDSAHTPIIDAIIQQTWIPPDPPPTLNVKSWQQAPTGFPRPPPQQDAVNLIWNIPPDPLPELGNKYIPLAPSWQPYVSHQLVVEDLTWNIPADPMPIMGPKYIPLALSWIPSPTNNWSQQNTVEIWDIPPDPQPTLNVKLVPIPTVTNQPQPNLPQQQNVVAEIWNIPPDPMPISGPKYIPLAPAWGPYVTHQQEIADYVWNIPPDPMPIAGPKYIPLAPSWQPSYLLAEQQNIVNGIWNIPPDPAPQTLTLRPQGTTPVQPQYSSPQQNIVAGIWNIPPDPMPIVGPQYVQLAPSWQPSSGLAQQQDGVVAIWNIPPDPMPILGNKYIPLAPSWQPFVTHQQEIVTEIWNIPPDPMPQPLGHLYIPLAPAWIITPPPPWLMTTIRAWDDPDPMPILPWAKYPANIPPAPVNNPPFGIPNPNILETIGQWWEPPPPQPTLNVLQTPPTGPSPPPVVSTAIDPDAVPPYREPLTPEIIRLLKKMLARRKFRKFEEESGIREVLLAAIAERSWAGEEKGPTPERLSKDHETQLSKVNDIKRQVEEAGGKGVYDFRPAQREAESVDIRPLFKEYVKEDPIDDTLDEEAIIERAMEKRMKVRRLFAAFLMEDDDD